MSRLPKSYKSEGIGVLPIDIGILVSIEIKLSHIKSKPSVLVSTLALINSFLFR
jgi:hypothetical protein